MNSLIFRVISQLLLPLMLLFSLFILFRGHNAPGGGFIGGLLSGASLIVYALAFDTRKLLNALPLSPLLMIALGLLLSFCSALLPLFINLPFLTGLWWETPFGWTLGSSTFFDIGVYFVVVGMSLKILLALLGEEE